MNFEEVIEKLYSLDDELICDVLNNGLHVSQCVDADNAVCTGLKRETEYFNKMYKDNVTLLKIK